MNDELGMLCEESAATYLRLTFNVSYNGFMSCSCDTLSTDGQITKGFK
jgi:hypothetical protein